MEKIIKILLVGMMVGLLSGCGEPTLDMSTDEARKASVKEVIEALPAEKKEEFKKSLTGFFMMASFASAGEDLSDEELQKRVADKLDGKTGQEVIDMVKEIANSK